MSNTKIRKNAGKYRHYVEILKYDNSMLDALGQPIERHINIGKKKCFIEVIKGTEHFDGALVESNVNYYIEMRYIDLITNRDRIQFTQKDGVVKHLNIYGIFDDKSDSRYMSILALGDLIDATNAPKVSPKVVSNIIEDAEPKKIIIHFNKVVEIANLNQNLSSIIVTKNGTQINVISYKSIGNPIKGLELTFADPFISTDQIKWHYVGSGFITDELNKSNLTNILHTVTNKVLGTHPIPTNPHVISSVINDAQPDIIEVTYNEKMKGTPAEIAKAINTLIAGGNNVPFQPVSISFAAGNSAILYFKYAIAFAFDNQVSWAYNDAHPTANLSNIAGVEAENQSYAVTNNINKVIPVHTPAAVLSATIEDAAKDKVIVIFDSDIKAGLGTEASYFEVNTVPAASYNIKDARTIELTFTKPFAAGVSYILRNNIMFTPHRTPVISANDTALLQINSSITNNVKVIAIPAADLFHEDFNAFNRKLWNAPAGVIGFDFNQFTDRIEQKRYGEIHTPAANFTAAFKVVFDFYMSPDSVGDGFYLILGDTATGRYNVKITNNDITMEMSQNQQEITTQKFNTPKYIFAAGEGKTFIKDARYTLTLLCNHAGMKLKIVAADTIYSRFNRDLEIVTPMPYSIDVNKIQIVTTKGVYKFYDLIMTEIKP